MFTHKYFRFSLLNLGWIIGLFWLLNGCENEEPRPTARPYPVIQTNAPTALDETGVTMNGQVLIPTNQPVTQHGFLITSQLIGSFEVKLGALSGNAFQFDVRSGLRKNSEYLYRAYVESNGVRVISEPVAFVAKGSRPPTITGFSPARANPGDTIIINGSNFGPFDLRTSAQVRIGGFPAQMITYSDTQIRIIVPNNVPQEGQLTLELFGATYNAPGTFQVAQPPLVITEFGPTIGYWGDTITVKGRGFVFEGQSLSVRLGEVPAQVIAVTETEVQIKVPDQLTYATTNHPLRLSLFRREAVSTVNFTLARPEILSVSTSGLKIGEKFIIYGKNFLSTSYPIEVAGDNSINGDVFPSQKLKVVRVTNTEIEVEATSDIDYFSILYVRIKNVVVSFGQRIDYFKYDPPVISNVLPQTVYPYQFIEIEGSNFFEKPMILLDELPNDEIEIIEQTPTYLKVLIRNVPSQTGYRVTVSVDHQNSNTYSGFNILPPGIQNSSPSTAKPSEKITINGWGLPMVEANNYAKVLNGQFVDIYNQRRDKYLHVLPINTSQSLVEIDSFHRTWTSEGEVVFEDDSYRVNVQLGVTLSSSNTFSFELGYPFWKWNDGFPESQITRATFAQSGDNFYIFGGIKGENILQSVWKYNLSSGNWGRISDMPSENSFDLANFSIGEDIYLIGGYSTASGKYRTWKFNPTTETWTQQTDFPGLPYQSIVGFSKDGFGYIMLLEGAPEWDRKPITLYRYDPSQNTWTQVSQSPFPPYPFPFHAAQVTIGDRLILFSPYHMISYDVITGEWTNNSLTEPIYSVAENEGRVFAFGERAVYEIVNNQLLNVAQYYLGNRPRGHYIKNNRIYFVDPDWLNMLIFDPAKL